MANTDHREYKRPELASVEHRRAEKAEANTRRLWIAGFAVLVAAGLAVAFMF
jgi:hypothetical protein